MDHAATATSHYGCGCGCGCDSSTWTADDTKGISGVRVLSGGHRLPTASTPQGGTLTADRVSHPWGGTPSALVAADLFAADLWELTSIARAKAPAS